LKILGYLRRMIDDRDLLLGRMALSHGQVRRVLAQLGLRSGDSEAQFDAWLKYVRRQGVPFYPNELGRGAGVNVTYRFHHVMELAVALALRTQGILPLDLLTLLMRQRPVLRPLYHQAYREHDRGLGATLTLRCEDGTADQLPPAGAPAGEPMCVQGTFLDLQLDYLEGGTLTRLAPPRLLGPREAIGRFTYRHSLHYPRPPLPLSRIACDIVRLAKEAPELRRGRA
jgi:hypothetical protein